MLDISPLSILKKRRLNWAPPTFHMFQFGSNEFLWDTPIADWIEYKLKGRYCLVNLETDTGTKSSVGFEDEKELTYFMLACPYTRR
jgi:hypothetical protein